MSNALADCASELIIRPGSSPCLRVGGNVWRHNLAGQILERNHFARAVIRQIGDLVKAGPIVRCGPAHAPASIFGEVLAAREPLRGGLESSSCCRPHARPNKW